MTPHHIPAFGEAVKALLRAHGLSLRSQKIRTGIDHMTMKDMCDGIRPRLEKVEQFARAFGEDVNRWRMLAGYEPVEEMIPAAGPVRFFEGIRAIQAEFPTIPVTVPRLHLGSRELTPELADALLRDIREFIQEEAAAAAAEAESESKE